MPGLTPEVPAKPGCAPRRSCTYGCFIVAILFMVVMWYGMKQAVRQATVAADTMMSVLPARAQVPAAEQEKMQRITKRIGDQLLAGDIPFENWSLAVGATHYMLGMRIFELEQIQKSGLSEDEKAAAARAMQRCAHGLSERWIDQKEFSKIFPPLGTPEEPVSPTDEQLREFIAAFKKSADAAKVPDEPYTFDYSAELERAAGPAQAQ